MKLKQFVAATLIAGIIGINYCPMAVFAIEEQNQTTVTKEKNLTKKQKKEIQQKENHLKSINIDWWTSCNDQYLTEYIFKALANNYDLKIATLRVEEARQAERLQFSNELPSISAGAAPALLKLPTQTNTEGAFGIPIIASYEADIFLKNRDKTRSVKKMYEASQYREKATYIAVAAEVGAVYYNIVKLDKLIDIQDKIIKDRKEIYELMKMSNEQGIVSTSDFVKANKAYVISTTDMIELKKARTLLLNALCVLTGESPVNAEKMKRISYNKIETNKVIPVSIQSDVITARPDYMVAQKMLEKAGIDVRVAKKEFLPTFNILGLMALSTSSMMPAMNWENALGFAAVNAMLPLFTGGARIANLKINKTRFEQALVNYQKTNIVAIQEVNDSLSTLKLDNEKYLTNVKAYKMEQEDFGFTKAKYKQGVISKLDLIQKQENLHVMQKLVVNNKTECLVDHISLYKATGANL